MSAQKVSGIETKKRGDVIIQLVTWIFIIYLIFVISICVNSTYQGFFISIILLSIILLVATVLLRKSKKGFESRIKDSIVNNLPSRAPRLIPIAYFSIVLLTSFVYWLGYYPGGFNLDACGQWLQAHKLIQYNDWHPFVSTLWIQFILWIYDSFDFYIVLQIIFFSAAVSFLLHSIQHRGIDYRLLCFIALYIGINPAIGLNTINMTKDTQFTILIVMLTGIFFRILSSDGKWLKSKIHFVEMLFLTIAIMLVRHNGFLFIIPTYLGLALSNKALRGMAIKTCIAVLVITIVIKGPIATMINVQKHDNLLGEVVGVPMGMMANALVSDEENIPENVHTFLNNIADDNAWSNNYMLGEWDSCKWEFGGIELLKDYTAPELLKYTYDSILKCPQACYEAFRINTQLVWMPFATSLSWIPDICVEENEFDIYYSPISPFNEITGFMERISCVPMISFAFWNCGFFLAILIITWLLDKEFTKRQNILLLLPIFVYTISTMLLLSGPNQRYIYFVMVLTPPIILFSIYESPKEMRVL